MTGMPWTGDEAFKRELATISKARLKLQVSAGALIAIVSASHVLEGVLNSTLSAKGLPMFGLTLGLYVVAHYSLLLLAKRDLEG